MPEAPGVGDASIPHHRLQPRLDEPHAAPPQLLGRLVGERISLAPDPLQHFGDGPGLDLAGHADVAALEHLAALGRADEQRGCPARRTGGRLIAADDDMRLAHAHRLRPTAAVALRVPAVAELRDDALDAQLAGL